MMSDDEFYMIEGEFGLLAMKDKNSQLLAHWVSVGVDVASRNINKSSPAFIKAQLSLTP